MFGECAGRYSIESDQAPDDTRPRNSRTRIMPIKCDNVTTLPTPSHPPFIPSSQRRLCRPGPRAIVYAVIPAIYAAIPAIYAIYAVIPAPEPGSSTPTPKPSTALHQSPRTCRPHYQPRAPPHRHPAVVYPVIPALEPGSSTLAPKPSTALH